jgi:hypothetical protein
MLNIEDLHKYRQELLNSSLDENMTLSENQILYIITPTLTENKLLENDEFIESYYISKDAKVNGYKLNDTCERLQLFLINENSINFNINESELCISTKKYYDDCFNNALRFIKNSIKGYYKGDDAFQDGDPLSYLNSRLSTSIIEELDVIEIFLISLTATISNRGAKPEPKSFEFSEEIIETTFNKDGQRQIKKVLIIKRLIDLNYLYTVDLLKGKGLELNVDLEEFFGQSIEVLKAASGSNFETYLCVIPADGIANVYQKENTRLLEKNVRSFLQFTGTNKGIKKTIKETPEKFIAFNNGLTITATGKTIIQSENKLFLKSLNDFQIVNGGQTTASLYFARKEGIQLTGINVMAKINIVNDADDDQLNKLVADISLYSNTQTKVSKVDLNSRNEQLSKIKKFSISVLTPTNKRWFFENKKGEYKTELLLAGKNKKVLFEREYPKDRLISKEELGKYYMSWGQQPYYVKLGGDKLFRYFLEELEGDGEKIKPKIINRDFYEELIAKVILFRSLEKIHGDSRGKNNIGNLRSAVIPYTLAILNKFTDDPKANLKFDLQKIWRSEKIDLDLERFLYKLMVLVNKLIKIYSKTDDYGSYAKKESLWLDLKNCKEVNEFMSTPESKNIIKSYTVVLEKNKSKSDNNDEIDFETLLKTTRLFDLGELFYTKLPKVYSLNDIENRRIEFIKSKIKSKEDIDINTVEFVDKIIDQFRMENNLELENLILDTPNENILESTLNFLIKSLNDCLSNNKNILSEFNKIKDIASAKGAEYSSVYNTIGKKFESAQLISIKDVFYASHYFKLTNPQNVVQVTKTIYLKKIVNQDLDKTPSFSVEAIQDFFKISLKNGKSVMRRIKNISSGNVFEVEFKKRNTRDEYRIFINELIKELSPREKDILVFRMVTKETYTCEHIPVKTTNYKRYNDLFKDNKNHIITNI